MYSVTKDYTFDAAHRLVQGYRGKCSNIHGHTWKVRLTVRGTELNEFGFVRDFSDFKPMKDWIDDNLDHGLILAQSDKLLVELCKDQGMRHFVMQDNPTSEALCLFLLELGRKTLNIPLSEVEIFETCTSAARYTSELPSHQ